MDGTTVTTGPRLRWAWPALLALGLASGGGTAAAAPLPGESVSRLYRGETLVFEKTLESDTRRYVGGVTYCVVEATVEELDGLFFDQNAYARVLPMTKSATRVGPLRPDGKDFFVELRQGNGIVEATYTLQLRRDRDRHGVAFWLDHARPHGIEDAWGFFRYEPLPDGATDASGRPFPRRRAPGTPLMLLTYGVLADVGDGLVRQLFEEKIRATLLSVPERLRGYVSEPRPRR